VGSKPQPSGSKIKPSAMPSPGSGVQQRVDDQLLVASVRVSTAPYTLPLDETNQRRRRMVRSLLSAAMTVVLGVSMALPTYGQRAGAQRAAAPSAVAMEFVLGNVEFSLVHELAHLLIAEKDVPIIGSEESAADYIAILALIREDPIDPTQRDRALKSLVAAADAFAIAWQTGVATGADAPYWESHALSIQRYYQVACLLYGSDPAEFERVPEIVGLPETRSRNCAAEFANANRSIDWLLAVYGRQRGDPPGAETAVVYERPRTLVATRVLEQLQSLQLLERIVQRLHERFALERPFTVVMRQCGQGEAAWLPDRREVVICYDLIDRLYVMGLNREARPLGPVAPRG
jgi:hypothetical protein